MSGNIWEWIVNDKSSDMVMHGSSTCINDNGIYAAKRLEIDEYNTGVVEFRIALLAEDGSAVATYK